MADSSRPTGRTWRYGLSDLQGDGDRALVDELDQHVGAKTAGGDGGSEGAKFVDHGLDQRLSVPGPGGGSPTRSMTAW